MFCHSRAQWRDLCSPELVPGPRNADPSSGLSPPRDDNNKERATDGQSTSARCSDVLAAHTQQHMRASTNLFDSLSSVKLCKASTCPHLGSAILTLLHGRSLRLIHPLRRYLETESPPTVSKSVRAPARSWLCPCQGDSGHSKVPRRHKELLASFSGVQECLFVNLLTTVAFPHRAF